MQQANTLGEAIFNVYLRNRARDSLKANAHKDPYIDSDKPLARARLGKYFSLQSEVTLDPDAYVRVTRN